MSSASILKEALIAGITATVAIPLLWMLGAVVSPERDVHSPGLDLVVLTLAGAVMVMLLRSTWRNTADASWDGDDAIEHWNRTRVNDRYRCGQY